MYIIINRTKRTISRKEGNFPDLSYLYELGHDFYIISLYSMTIKIPITLNSKDDYSIKKEYPKNEIDEYEVEFNELPLPKELIKEEYLINMNR